MDLVSHRDVSISYSSLLTSTVVNRVSFCLRVTIVYTVLIAALVNLSILHDNSKLWLTLISSAYGTSLGQPKVKTMHNDLSSRIFR